MKKALVTGGAGFIGSHIVDALVERGVAVDIIDDLSSGNLKNIQGHLDSGKAHIDIVKIEDCDPDWGEYDTVFHPAARARIQPSITNPTETDIANVHGTVRALEIARKCGAHFVFSGSSSVYGPGHPMPLVESMTPDPQNPYALTKLVDELYCDLYRKLYGMSITSFRYFNVFGPRQLADGPYSTVVGIFIRQAASGERFQITDDGEQRRDFTYVKDIVAANMLAGEKKLDGLFNVGTGRNTTVNEIADAIAGKNYPRDLGVKRLAEVRETLADNSKLRAEGWEPTVGILDWIKDPV